MRIKQLFHLNPSITSNFTQENKEKFSKGFIVVTRYCAMERLRIQRHNQCEEECRYFQEIIMDPIFYEDISWLYGDDASKVLIHVVKASSHTGR